MTDVPSEGRRPILATQTNAGCAVSFSCCPGFRLEKKSGMEESASIASLKSAWGPVQGIWEGYAVDPEVRYKGSSGGVATALALFAVETERVYGVLHISASQDEPVYNETVFSRTRASILAAAGSRYSPASPCEKLSFVESAPKPCLVIGKPCDIAAVKAATLVRSQLRERVFLTVACFCAGTPSTQGTLAMLHGMGIDDPNSLSGLRYRGHGWPGKTEVFWQTGGLLQHASLSYEQSWGEILQKYRQWRCYICPDHTGEFADIALGDPWYRTPEDNEPGRSLILARTRRGRAIIEAMIKHGCLCAETTDPSLLAAAQPNLLKARSRLWGQLLALRLLGLPSPTYEGFNLRNLWLRNLTMKEKTQSILGTIKRAAKKKLYQRRSLAIKCPLYTVTSPEKSAE